MRVFSWVSGVPIIILISLTFMGGQALAEARVLVVGDSLSAAYGIPVESGWVNLLQHRLDSAGYEHQVINASISGDTTRGGLSRLPDALAEHRPEVVVIQLGANDGLRGFAPDRTRSHLRQMIQMAREAGARILLLGVQLPGNYGNEFRRKFHHVYHELADQEAVAMVPFFLDGVAQDFALMQADGIHPSAAAQPKILDNVWPMLAEMLSAAPASVIRSGVSGRDAETQLR